MRTLRNIGLALAIALTPVLVAEVALAGGNGVGSGGLQGFQPVNPGSFTPSNAPNLYQCTTAAMTLYVDVDGGSDSNDCTAAGTSACATIQGAVNKTPRCLRHGVTINVAPGNYDGFTVSGFICDPSVQTTTGGLFIDAFAAFADAGVATGVATGTASATTAGSGTTFGTLYLDGGTWTTNDLTGRFVTSAGQTRVIASNTADTITIVGTWTSPGAVAFAIQDPGVNITTATTAMATGLQSASANNAAIMLADNNCGARTQSITIRGLRISNTSGHGVMASDQGLDFVTLSQLRASSTGTITEAGAGFGPGFVNGIGIGRLDMTDCDILVPQNGTGFTALASRDSLTRVEVRSTATGTTGISTSGQWAQISFTADVNGPVTPVSIPSGAITSGTMRITCASSAGTGLQIGTSAAFTSSQFGPSTVNIGAANIATCGIGASFQGALVSGDLTALTGSAATTGIAVLGGATVTFTAASTTITGGTQAISIDQGGVTAALADVTAGNPLSGGASGSKVFAR